jgi:23S rRNA (cytidine2498-2'-O)-methyltransferase
MGQELEGGARPPGALGIVDRGPGWILTSQVEPAVLNPLQRSGGPALTELAFPHLVLEEPVEIRAESVNALANQIFAWFAAAIKSERIDAPYSSVWDGPAEQVGLGRRIGAVEDAWAELLKKRLSRVSKLAMRDLPRGVGPARGIFVWFTDFQRAFVARSAWCNGQRRMADDPDAPSRSYLKVEEAYGILGREPAPGERVADLGAAPGGWSFSAARRGASVVAVDNGPLKGGALNQPLIEHLRSDAFRFVPQVERVVPHAPPFDWLFCDLLEEPHHVISSLLQPWLEHRWCRRFVVNLKFGRVDAVALLRELRAPNSPLARAHRWQVRHLFHDREEFTVTGEVDSP